MSKGHGKYFIIDLDKLAVLETDILEEIKECSCEYGSLDELIEDVEKCLAVYRKDVWDAYIEYVKEWAKTYEDQKHVGASPDSYDAFYSDWVSNKEGESDEQD